MKCRAVVRLAVAAAVLAAAVLGVAPAEAKRVPTLTLDRAAARPGERVLVTLDGFDGRAVTISVCGNLALRGSADCNMIESHGLGLEQGHPTASEVVIAQPPVPCPCVVRAATTLLDQIAVASLELVGAAVAPVRQPDSGELVSVAVAVRPRPEGLVATVRSWLGGPTPYAVTIRVTNNTAAVLDAVDVVASAGRDVGRAYFDVPDVGILGPRQTKTLRATMTLPAPVVGRFVWDVTAAGAGTPARATEAVRATPPLLVVLAGVLAVDVGAIIYRRVRRNVTGRQEPGVRRRLQLVR